jgi:EmrB/QacA subfamily drug resistance transporter
LAALKPSHDSPPDSDADRHVTVREFLRLFVAIMLPMVMASLDQGLLATATPIVAAELGELHDSSWIITAYMLMNALTVQIYGRLGDRHGRREMLFVAMGFYVAGAVVSGTAQSMTHLIIGRSIQGIGGGGLMSLSQALIGELIPPRQRARFQVYFATLFTVSSMLGPVLGGFVVAHASWRWLYFMVLPLAALAVVLLMRLPRGERHPDSPGVDDRVGLVLFSMAMLSLLYGVSSGGHRFAWLSWQMALLAGTSLVSWVALLGYERRHPAPFFPIELLRIKTLRLSMITVIVTTFCFLSLVFYLPVYLQIGLHVDAGQSGLLLMPALIGQIAGGTLAGRIVARTGHPKMLPVWGLAMASAAFAGLAVAPADILWVEVLVVIATLGMGPSLPMAQLVAQVVAGRKHLGATMATVSQSRTLGGAIGTAVVGAIVYGLLPDIDLPHLMRGGAVQPGLDEQIVGAFHAAFAVMSVAAAFGSWNASRVPAVRF